MSRHYCTKEGMGNHFKCIFFGSIYLNRGNCTKEKYCEYKQIDPRDKVVEE